MNPEWIGAFAAVLTTSAYIPQVVKVFRTRHTASISVLMYAMMSTGIGLWCLYGIFIGSLSLILANGISLLLTLSVLALKLRHG